MPLDPKFETSAGLQRFREQIGRENRCRLFSNHKPSEAAQIFLAQRKQQLKEEAEAQGAKKAMGSRGTAGRSGVVSSTQKNVIDEGYDMILKSEWAASCEGVNSNDPIFKELNSGTVGKEARSLHNQREESARCVSATRERMLHEKEENLVWTDQAHHIVDEGWERAKHASISRQSTTRVHATVREKTAPEIAADIRKKAEAKVRGETYNPEDTSCSSSSVAGSSSVYTVADGSGSAIGSSINMSNAHKKKTIGLASAGVRAPTYTQDRHANLTSHMRGIYEAPPKAQHDVFAALEHIQKRNAIPTKSARNVELPADQKEKQDRKELQDRVDALQKKLAEEKDQTHKMAEKLEVMKEIAKQN